MRRFFRYFPVFLLVCILYAAGMFIVDPMQLFHKKWFGGKDRLFKFMYVQDAGMINSLEFDSVILGSSMLENTSADEASEVLGGKFVNMSLTGSDFDERVPVLEYLLKKRRVDKIIYSMESSFLKMGKDSTIIAPFAYLYDDSRLNDVLIYFSDSYYHRCVFSLFMSKKCWGDASDSARPSAWKDYPWHSTRYGGLNNWFLDKDNEKINTESRMIFEAEKKLDTGVVKAAPKSGYFGKIKHYIDVNLLKYAEMYPETEFILVFPPYSRLNQAMKAQTTPTMYYYYVETIRYLAKKSGKLTNIRVFGFDNLEYTANLANYKDLTHYKYDMNSMMLKYFAEGRGLLSGENVDAYIKEITDEALRYDIRADAALIRKYRAEQESASGG